MKKRIIKIIILIAILVAIGVAITITLVIKQRNYEARIESYKEKWLYNGEGNVSLDDLESSFDKYADSIVGEK